MARDEAARDPDAERSLLEHRSCLRLAAATTAFAGDETVSADESSDDTATAPAVAEVTDGSQ